MKFLCLVSFTPDAFDTASPEDLRQLDDNTIEHDNWLRASGHLLIASPLAPVETGVTLGERRAVRMAEVDGPFAETKEVVGGFLLIEAASMDAAVALFENDPILKYGRMEIRPLLTDHVHSETGQRRPDFQAI